MKSVADFLHMACTCVYTSFSPLRGVPDTHTHTDTDTEIINSSEVSSVDFDQVLNTNADMLRRSLDGSKVLLKYEGTQPFFLLGKTEYSSEEIKEILSGPEWWNNENILSGAEWTSDEII